jgi:phage gp36-like protein
MAFLSKTDLSQDIYAEILSGISRADDAKIATACAEALAEINGYVCIRYDSEDLMTKTEDNRSKVILSIARTIAIYKLHKACNTMPELIRLEYEDAVKLLEKIQSGKFFLEGAKLKGQTETVTPTTQISRTGNTRRENYFNH